MEETMVMNEQQPVENKKVNKNNTWKSVVIGGVSGIAFGGVATAAVAATTNHTSEDAENGETTLTGVSGSAHVDGSVPVAQVSDDMSFSEAFHAAHEQVGPGGVFVWHGQVYGTYTADEWNSMTPAEQAEFGSHVHVQYAESSHTSSQSTNHEAPVAEVVAEQPATTTEHQSGQVAHVNEANNTNNGTPEQQEIQVEVQEPPVTVAQQPTNTGNVPEGGEEVIGGVSPVEPEVEVLAYETISNEDGSQMDLAVVSVGGQEMGIYDVNQDGTADLMAIDANNNQQIEDNEITDISSEGLSMQPLHDEYIAQNDPSMQGPDYINDGDVDNYMA